jgi:sugar lactone lactonase YvrE
MLTTKLTLGLLAAGLFAACASDDGGDPGGPDPDPGNSGEDEVPFTNGVSTLAGKAEAGYVDGERSKARFSNPVNVIYRNGTVYVADFDNDRLRAINTQTYVTTTVISQPGFKRPFGLAFAADGTLYVSTDNDQAGGHDDMSGTIWRVDVNAKTATVVANAIGRPRGMAVLPDGRIAVADYLHHVIQVIDPGNGSVDQIAGAWDATGMVDGSGDQARFSAPYFVTVRGDGKLMVTDFDNNRIRVVGLDGTTGTLSGGDEPGFVDGTMSGARWSRPQAMSVAANGDVYVTDLGNFRVRRIVGDRVETVMGSGTGGFLDIDDPLAAQVYGLEGLSVVPDASMLYVADGSRGEQVPYNRVRQVKLR